MGKKFKTGIFRWGFISLLSLLITCSAYAMHFELGDKATLDWETTLRYSSAFRVEKQNDKLISSSNANADDGNRNFDRGLIKNRFDVLTETDLSFGEVGIFDDFGFFVRGRAWYDHVYSQTNDNDSPATSNNVSVPHNEFTDDTTEWMGKKAEFLDYFIYSAFNVAGRSGALRIGSQVLSWGESLFISGGIASAQSPLDATSANIPGVELKEIFLPVEQVSFQADLTDAISIEGYYQWKWEKTRLDAAGSYFSTADMIDEGGESLILGPGLKALRGEDNLPSHSGQWGVAVRYLADWLASTEFGLYYINYHDKTPQLNLGGFTDMGGTIVPTQYYLSYIENIHLWGASFGTVLGSTNVSGELSYRENAPAAVIGGPLGTQPERTEIYQGQVSAIHFLGTNALMDNLTLTAEVGFNHTKEPNGMKLANDEFAWGYTMKLEPTWYGVLPKLDLNLPVTFSQGVNGNSSVAGTFTENKNKLGATARFTYDVVYQLEIGYVGFFGGPENNNQDDRDFVSLNFKYTF